MKLPQGAFNSGDMIAYRRLLEDHHPRRLVEIGCWMGRSLCSVAEVVRHLDVEVWAVDNFSQEGIDLKDRVSLDVRAEFLRAVHEFHLPVKLVESDSAAAASIVEWTDVVFIDGDHRPERLRRDLDAWESRTRLVLAGHDYRVAGGSPMYAGIRSVLKERYGDRVQKYPQDVAPMNKVWKVVL